MAISIDEGQISKLVDEVMRRVQGEMDAGAPAAKPLAPQVATPDMTTAPLSEVAPAEGIFASMDEAILAAEASYREFKAVSLHRRKRFIDAMREVGRAEAQRFAEQTVAETGLGRVADKVQKVLLAVDKTPGTEDLIPVVYTGDDGMALVEPAPYGVVGCITPSTNPTPTVINNGISAVAAGNAIVFNPHPSAKGVSNRCIRLLNQAIQRTGGPATLLCSVAEPTLETSQAIMKHPGIRMLIVTGGGAVVQLAMTSGKKCIAAGPGNPPVIVDDTAHIAKAARCIVDGASFDNNVLCTAEKEVFVFENVADALISEMVGCGAYRVPAAELEKLLAVLMEDGEPYPYPNRNYPHPNRTYVGKDAGDLLAAVGIQAGRDVSLVICEVPFEHPLVHAEMLMPILPIVRVKDLEQALAYAIEAEHGNRHSAVMHSESVSNLSRVARDIETTIFTKNAPSYAGLGFGGEGFCTLSIAGPTGEGLTSARSFTRQRRCVLAGGFRII